ncbi:serine/threonine-protein phosphatase [Blastococcus sp. MG754426]|uniref:PP2C family protein-serine/threonine phosphatase n=1 Tax=unclassified Blastococcus TaxID=2619396 RepID=UPI001EEFAD96|nr:MULTISPECIES: PP2C family protein-serine/threonine phosphatase [unclassified Blastococcus]MCF6506272.1 serine/threonine-protein phosphatase [Blastococcus sp. MG754426]MCF6510912.1 serine/threonine-protein phosphatase [Blastococcus sp. MG754427]
MADDQHAEEQAPTEGFRDRDDTAVREESLGERVLGSLLDRAHLIPPRLVGPLVAQELAGLGCRDVAIHLQDYDQRTLQPLRGRGLHAEVLPIDGSAAGRAFATEQPVETDEGGGAVRLHLPMLDGSDRVGVLSFTLDRVNAHDRRLAQRLAGLVADLVVTKSEYTDAFAQARTTRPMSLAAQLQWQTLPPLSMKTPELDLAGVLEPAYEVGGDCFDYAYDHHTLHLAVFDAMGHGLEAATMSTVVTAAYRHGRRADVELARLCADMDGVVAAAYPGRFATAHVGQLDTRNGVLTYVNAGHPAALLVRDGRVADELPGPTARPLGLGTGEPGAEKVQLQPGDRVLFFTDGVVEERLDDGEQFGEHRLRELLEQSSADGLRVPETVRRLSHALMDARHGRTSDDASLLLVEWKQPPHDDELSPDIPEARPTRGHDG